MFYVDGQSTSFNITNLLPFQIISVDISASTVVGEGPHSSQLEIQTAQARKSNNVKVEVTRVVEGQLMIIGTHLVKLNIENITSS